MITSGLLISGGATSETGPRIIDGMYISPMYEEIVPIDDGKEITVVAGWDYLKFWRHKIISELIGFFNDTILYEVIIILSPFIFGPLSLYCIFRWSSNKKKNQSPLPENILTHIKANPGCTQKQLVEAMGCSRGSVCYHLDKLLNTNRLRRVYTSTVPHYYSVSVEDSAINPLEQNIQYLISQKKSGMVLRSIHENPATTRKELAKVLSLSPVTIRWYLNIFSEKKLLTLTKNGREFHYALTTEAKEIYEHLVGDLITNPQTEEQI